MELNTEDTTPAAEASTAGSDEAAPVRRRASRRVTAPAAAPAAEAPAGEAPAAEAPAAADAPAAAEAPAEAPKRATRSRKKADAEAPVEAAEEAPAASAPTSAVPAAEGDAAPAEAPKKRGGRQRKTADAPADDSADAPAAKAEAEKAVDAEAAPAAEGDAAANGEGAASRRSRGRSGRSNNAGGNGGNGGDSEGDAEAAPAEENGARTRGDRQAQGQQSQGGRGDGNGDAKQEAGSRSSRTRQRDRKRRTGDDLEPEIAEDDVLLPIAGILDVLDNYAFVRTSGYLPGVSDVYVALGQVKKYGLRRGDAIVGAIRQPREGDNGGRQKYNAIVKIDSVNGKPVDEAETRPDIAEMTPVFPQQRLRLGGSLGKAIDAVAPVGLGQRGLIVLPAQFTGAEVVRELAADIAAASPDSHLIVVLTDAQPEVATELSRTVSGEVVAATFDRLPEDQTTISELGIDRARRLVELGHDVVVLVDSLNRLARGYAQSQQPSARPALGTIDEHAIFQVKRLLAAARNVENGGSLTVIATVNAKQHGSKRSGDALLLREASAVANSVIALDEESTIDAPAVDARSSRTQHLQAMLDSNELALVNANRAKASAAASK